MDLETYIAKYSGETRLQRLLLVARTTTDEAVANQAFDLAEEQMRADGNVNRYKEVFMEQQQQQSASEETQSAGAPQEQRQDVVMTSSSSADLTLPHRRPSKPFDAQWVIDTETANRADRHALQGRLSTSQSHLHKDAIRTAYIALAQHDIQKGALREALGSLLRATDYCASRSQTTQISLLILEVCLGLEQYAHVREYVHKVEHTLNAASGGNLSPTPASAAAAAAAGGGGATASALAGSNSSSPENVSIKLKIARGLDRLAQGDYAMAGEIFTKLTMTTNSAKLDWPGVASAEDIALYASLLCVATQNRASIFQLSEHPEALELVPNMKELLAQWSRANYVKCMEAFSDSSSNDHTNSFVPLGDLYLSGKSWKALSQTIREKCLLEYLKPYQCVRLDSMMQMFPSIINLEDTLVDLMSRGLVPNAKIDARANVLFKTKPKKSVNLAAMERRVLDGTYSMLIRLACLENDLCVQDAAARGGRRGGGAATNAASSSLYDDDDSEDGEGDTPMLDADAPNTAANPEDLY